MGAGASTGIAVAINHASIEELTCVVKETRNELGKITDILSELDAAGAPNNQLEARLLSIFEECDTDNSGDIDVDELTEALKRDQEMAAEYGLQTFSTQIVSREQVETIFDRADADNNKVLSWPEFRDVMIRLRNGEIEIPNHELHPHESAFLSRTSSRPSVLRNSTLSQFQQLSEVEPSERANVLEWHINYWALDDEDRLRMVLQTINESTCLRKIVVPVDVLRSFVLAVENKYTANPYHNYLHALATMHYVFKMVQTARLLPLADTIQASSSSAKSETTNEPFEFARSLQSSEMFSLIFSAICHDVGHRGRNNAFEIQTLSTLALRYNDRAPLENHHCATAFEVALSEKAIHEDGSNASCNIFRLMEKEVFLRVRQQMVSCILSTDMSLHNDHVRKLKLVTASEEPVQSDNGDFLLELLLHAADIGNPFMPPAISYKWGMKIAEEFTAQADEEHHLGLPVTAMMMGLSDPKHNAKSRVGFMDFVVAPLARPLFQLFPSLEVPKRHLEENHDAERKLMKG